MAEKIEWYGEIPADVKWLTFADQRDKGYEYDNPNNAHKITATTDDNFSLPYDEIKFVVKYNHNVNSRTCEVKFTQEGGKTDYCYISQNGTTFEQIWKHAPKKNASNKNTSGATDAVIIQSSNETQNDFEVAVGNYNKTRSNLLFSVGCGTSENDRRNSFEADNEKIKADKAEINFLTANTISASTICATTIVNENGEPFNGGSKVSYSAATKETDTCAYPIGILTIDDVKNVIYGINRDEEAFKNSQQAIVDIHDLSGKTVTRTEFENEYHRYASGLTDDFSAFTTVFDSFSGDVIQQISDVNSLVRTTSSNTLSLSDTVTKYYNGLNGKITGLTNSYNTLRQDLSGLSENVGHVENVYDSVSGQILSVTSAMDAFNVSYSGLSNQVSSITTQYDSLSGQVISNRENIGTLIATSNTFLSKLDSISVGGVNLLYDTNFDTFNKSDSKWSTWGSPSTLTMTKESDGWNWISIKSTDKYQGINQNQNSRRGAGYKEFKPNTYYTFSVYAYGNSTHMDLGVHFVNETGTVNVGQAWSSNDNSYSKSWGKGVIPLTSTKTRYWFTFKTPDDSTIKYFNAMIGFGSLSTNPSSDEVINIAKPQLEEGTIPTDWKENSDDYSKDMSSKIEQTVSSITLSVQENVENKLNETGIDIENGKITLKADNTNVEGDFKVSAVKDADGITLTNTKDEPTIMLKNQPINEIITNVQNGKFGGTARINLGWGTEVHTSVYNVTVGTEVCYIESGKQYTISGMSMSINTDNAGTISPIKITLSEGGAVLKTISNAQQNGLSSLNDTYTATHTGDVTLTAIISTNFNTMGKHPYVSITGTISRESSSIIAFGEGGFAMGLDTNKYMSFDKSNGLTVVNGNDGIRLNDYGLTRLRTKGGVNTWVGEAHNIYHLVGDGGWFGWDTEQHRAYDTILCTGDKDCNIALGFSSAFPLVDGMTINIIDKCKANCNIDFKGKKLYKGSNTDATTFGTKQYYELVNHRIWKFMYSEALNAWLEIPYNN